VPAIKPRRVPADGKHRSVVQIIYQLAALAVISVFIGAVVPGFVAYKSGVFDAHSIMARVKTLYPDVSKRLDQFELSREQARKALAGIDAQIAAGGLPPSNVAALRQAYAQEMSKAAPVSVQPFAYHLIDYFWPIMYFGLTTAIFVIRPSAECGFPPVRSSVPPMTILIFLFSTVPLLLRTLAFAGANSARTVYAWPNPDISAACFVCQIFNFGMFALCLAVIWVQWSGFAETHRVALYKEESVDNRISMELMTDLSMMLYRWQVNFVSISVGFTIYTAIFWNQIVRNHDYRFVVEAIMAHVFWIATIIITSIPLIDTWRIWHQQKLNAIIALVNDKGGAESLESRINAIKELQPIPGWNLTASAVAVLTSLIGPAVQSLIK
jgi:hypothetical protein